MQPRSNLCDRSHPRRSEAQEAYNQALGPNHIWTNDSPRVTADALDALGRTDEAKALRERYGVAGPEKPNSS
jgi:hypothetical protein